MKTILVDAIHAIIIADNGTWKIFEEMKDLLDKFPNRKIILTGADRGEKFKEYGLDRAPYEVFTLEHNPEKTDPNYFRIMLDRLKLNNCDVVYFEHNLAAVKSAESVGIKSYHYDERKRDLDALKKFLLKNLE